MVLRPVRPSDVRGKHQLLPDRAVRAQLYAQIERRVAAAVPIVYLFNPAYVYAYVRRLHGFAPNAFLPTWNAASWRIDGR